MKLKYYMRGVGTGILFAAFVFLVIIMPGRERDIESEVRSEYDNLSPTPTIAGLKDIINPETTPEPDTDEATLTPQLDVTDVPDGGEATLTPQAEVTDEPDVPSATPTSEPTISPTPTTAPTLSPVPTNTPAAEPTEAAGTEGEYITIGIFRGMSSEQVSEKAQNLGIVEDAEELNRYFVQNGYADLICVGNFRIPKGASYREIAQIVTNIENAIYE